MKQICRYVNIATSCWGSNKSFLTMLLVYRSQNTHIRGLKEYQTMGQAVVVGAAAVVGVKMDPSFLMPY